MSCPLLRSPARRRAKRSMVRISTGSTAKLPEKQAISGQDGFGVVRADCPVVHLAMGDDADGEPALPETAQSNVGLAIANRRVDEHV